MPDAYDYIIVGGGAAGCVLANKLSADPRNAVLLIEAGPTNRHPLVGMPKGFGQLLRSETRTWYYQANPGAAGKNTPETWVRGKMLGGSSSINGMMYMRGHPEDYDHWERDLGLSGWGWSDVGRVFRAMEDHELGETPFRGVGGPLHISVSRNRNPMMDRLIEGGQQMGLRAWEEPNEPGQAGIGYTTATIKRGRRQSAAVAFLDPARTRPNLRILTGISVDRVIIEDRRATGVVCSGGAGAATYRAGREVILAAGALVSPRILELSGIGDPVRLRRIGIEPRHELPGVGGNMREHTLLFLQHHINQKWSQNRDYSGWRLYLNLVRYALLHSGVLASPGYDLTAFVKSDPAQPRPNVQLLANPISMDMEAWEGWTKGVTFEKVPGCQMFGYHLLPESQGSVHAISADPHAPPEIVHNYLTHPKDQAVSIAMFRFMRALYEQPAVKPFITEEMLPGSLVQSDADILQAFNRLGGTGYHATGTCSMGNEPLGVVDARLRVRGVGGLRVCDLSVFPTNIAGNTQGPAMAAGWRGAELILEDHR